MLGPSPGGLSLAGNGGPSYAANVSASSFKPATFPVSFFSPSQKLSFKADDLSEGKSVWNSALIGYSLGPRPYYERLLKAMQRLWTLKGSMKLLSLADGFFLLKFSTEEDLEMVLSGGPWFLLGKPFILQRWSPRFKPKRDESTPIPIWIKIVDFPLVLWTPTGISKISSYIGVPISVDALTASRSRLTFARVCVLITKDSVLHDEIPIDIDGEDLTLKVFYDWKPDKCEGCGSLIHPFSLCPQNPNPQPVLPPQPSKSRGRSTSRSLPTRPNRSPSVLPPPKSLSIAEPPPSTVISNPLADSPAPTITLLPPVSASGQLPVDPPTSTKPPLQPKPILSPAKLSSLPNLNSPTEESSSSGLPASPSLLQPPKIPLLNKFASLQSDDHIPVDSLESTSEAESASNPNPEGDPSVSLSQEKILHNTRSSTDKGKSPNKSKPPKGKSAKKAKS
ncbi:hypothetical protein MA16_Dca011702 [Dendrobium catenatum]|uniref:DUF4283 domain-containing protein n=1 Tax=Dendrobium catenatum TaxID=906689 RepID=A0A2I0WY42_9ASPA|nr:hypothetical protein MA16_Dca011702 [Dendrobium catenatum]